MALNAFEGNTVNQEMAGQTVPTIGPIPNNDAEAAVVVAHHEFRTANQQASCRSEFLTRIAAVFERLIDAQCVVHFEARQDGPVQTCLIRSVELNQSDQDAICKTCNEAWIQQKAILGSWHNLTLLAVPMEWTSAECLLIGLPAAASATDAISIAYDALAQLCIRDQSAKDQEAARFTDQLAAITELVSKVESGGETSVSCKTLVDRLSEYLDCDVVAVGLFQGTECTCELVATSQSEVVDRDSQLVRDLQSVIYEAVARGQTSQWPPTETDSKHALRVHRFFVETTDFEAVHSLPLVAEDDQPVGVLVVAGKRESIRNEESIRFLLSARRPLAAALRLIHKTQRSRLFQIVEKAIKFWRSDQKRLVKGIVLCLLAAAIIPAPYRVKCDCELQPTFRRFVAAPFDGRLQETLVEPGDVVEQGSTLAIMDSREILLELSGAEEKLHVASQQHAGHLAKHETGEAQIAAHEVQRLQLQHKILKHREHHLNITSPIDGVVVEGDHKRSVGMPLQVGAPLFEIAPLRQMVVEISVPEDDIRFVEPGQSVSISLDAFSIDRFRGKLRKVHPRAELRDEANVFIAEINLDNAQQKLRPGMRGRARILAGWRPFGWILLHKPIAAVVELIGW